MSDASFPKPVAPSLPPKTTQSTGGIKGPDRSTKEYVRDTLECEGIEYGLVHYSRFEEYDDPYFHRLRLDFLARREAIIKHLGMENL